VLLVGEGDTEVAFLRHLADLYNQRKCGTSCTIRCAHGKGPEHILTFTIRQAATAAYDHKTVLLDTDIPWPDANVSKAKSHRIELLPSKPCLEGLLLDVLGRPVPSTTKQCKKNAKLLKLNLLRPDCYREHFPRPLLDRRSARIATLQRLIEITSGRKLLP
jgi:hypothetical protein